MTQMTQNTTTDDATDAQDRQVRFMTALAARDVDATNIRGGGRYVIADLPDDEAEMGQAETVAGEFGYSQAGAEYDEADDTDRTAVSFAPEVSDE
jgi:hypothetical protein